MPSLLTRRSHASGSQGQYAQPVRWLGVVGDGTDASDRPEYYSKGLYASISCSDYPQYYSLFDNFDLRIAEQNKALTKQLTKTPHVFDPFTFDEVRYSAYQENSLDICLQWRWPTKLYTPGEVLPPTATFSKAPALVLTGDLDVTTTNRDALDVIQALPNATLVVMKNSFHIAAVGDLNNCGSTIVVAFVANLTPGDTTCAKTIPPIRTVPKFASTADMLDPVAALPGNEATADERRIVAAAVATVGDSIVRFYTNLFGNIPGLRGGVTIYDCTLANGCGLTLKKVRWTNDVEVSGTSLWDQNIRVVTADVSILNAQGQTGQLHLSWSTKDVAPVVSISGTINGHAVVADAVAP